jgi:hypothetical protein
MLIYTCEPASLEGGPRALIRHLFPLHLGAAPSMQPTARLVIEGLQ